MKLFLLHKIYLSKNNFLKHIFVDISENTFKSFILSYLLISITNTNNSDIFKTFTFFLCTAKRF